MKERILIVDDERNVLDGFRRALHSYFSVYVALSGKDALVVLEKHGPFPVVISDMRMPEMNGVEFLQQVEKLYPDTVRIMLTGNADQGTAVDAINRGRVFQFLCKPVAADDFIRVIQKAITQHDLITAERELLENTLVGSIQVLVNILSLTNPLAFTRAMRIRQYARQVCKQLEISDFWQIEMAAMLSQVACVTIPSEVLEKHFAGEMLKDSEKTMIKSQPDVVVGLIGHIPRLEPVVSIISGLQDPPDAEDLEPTDYDFGTCLIHTLLTLDLYLGRGRSLEAVLKTLSQGKSTCNVTILKALTHLKPVTYEDQPQLISLEDINTGMVLDEDVRNRDGLLIAARGNPITTVLRQRLLNFRRQHEIESMIRVRLPRKDVAEKAEIVE